MPNTMESSHNLPILKDRRRKLRKESTAQEDLLWQELRNNKLEVKFKRQNSVGRYIVDFYCQKYKLIIEVDGEIHNTKEAREYDEIRDDYFISLNYKVLRFKNLEVENSIEKVLEKIKEAVS